MRKSQEERWKEHFNSVKTFIETNKCLPSRYRIEEHRMLNWLKYNKKMAAAGKLTPQRKEKFEELLAIGTGYHKVNQYTYASGRSIRKNDDNYPSLF